MTGAQCSGSSEGTEMSLGKERGSGGQEPAERCGRCLGDEPGSPPAVIPPLEAHPQIFGAQGGGGALTFILCLSMLLLLSQQ